jgi:hypothetical protein
VLRWSTVKAVSPQEFNGSPNVKDDEFEGDEQAHASMKGNVTAPFARHANTHKIALEIRTLANSLAGGNNAGFNPLYHIGGPRSIQLALKLQF